MDFLPVEKAGEWLGDALTTIWRSTIGGEGGWSGPFSISEAAASYCPEGTDKDAAADSIIQWHAAHAAGVGFAAGLPGITLMAAAVPADLMATAYIQFRMIATMAVCYGWNLKSQQMETMAIVALLGGSAAEELQKIGAQIGTNLALKAIESLPGKFLIEINKAVGFKLATKFGQTGVINLVRLAPLLGGIVGGGVNYYTTFGIGKAAKMMLQDGPAVAPAALPEETE